MERIELYTTADGERRAQFSLELHSERLSHLPDAGRQRRLVPAQRAEELAQGISTDAGEVLSDYVKKTTLRARVYRGSKEVTNDIAASRFHWKRTSADATADTLWNSTHVGVKQFQLTNADVFFSATYTCEISDE